METYSSGSFCRIEFCFDIHNGLHTRTQCEYQSHTPIIHPAGTSVHAITNASNFRKVY
jgi:hypothetical protein